MSRSGPTSVRPMMAVWGETYTRLLTELALPALLADGNLPALAREFPCVFRFHTTPTDGKRICESPVYQRLASIMPTEFVPLDWQSHSNKYAAMSAAHAAELRASSMKNAASLFLIPDNIWADGSLATVVGALRAGKRAVFHAAVRVTAETAIPAIRRQYRRAASPAMAIPARQLVQLALDHMHPSARRVFWDAPDFSAYPSNVCWRAGDEGMVVRGFHLHPLMVFPTRPVHASTSTADDDMPQLALQNFADALVVQDSDDALHVDLTVGDWGIGGPTVGEPAQVRHLVAFAQYSANQLHRRFFDHPIRIHTGARSAAWAEAERASANVARAYRQRLFFADLRLWVPGLAFGITRRRLTERSAREGLSWNLVARRNGALKELRRHVFVRVAVATFGVSVVAQALRLDGYAIWWRYVERGLLLRWLREAHLALVPAADARRRFSNPWGSRKLRPPRGKLRQFVLAFLAVRWVTLSRSAARYRRTVEGQR
jgi:hypothetical protein